MILRAYMGGRGGDAGEGAGGREGSARELGLQDEVEEEAEVVALLKLSLIVNRALSHHKHVAPLTNLAAQLHRGGRGYPLQLFGGRSKV